MKSKVVLAVLSVGLFAVLPSEACEPPSSFTNVQQITGSELEVILAVDQHSYDRGEPVQFFLSIRNVGEETFQHCNSSAPTHAFMVLPDSCETTSQDSCFGAAVFLYPEVLSFFGECVTIDPGSCRTWDLSWDGLIWVYANPPYPVLPLPGGYRIFGGLWSLYLVIVIPDTPLFLPITITDVVPAEETSWGSLKARYN